MANERPGRKDHFPFWPIRAGANSARHLEMASLATLLVFVDLRVAFGAAEEPGLADSFGTRTCFHGNLPFRRRCRMILHV
jgi:hypothetical protein